MSEREEMRELLALAKSMAGCFEENLRKAVRNLINGTRDSKCNYFVGPVNM